jgi:periplasmic protein TonB
MSGSIRRYENFDDIVFKVRNKDYGAFVLRKKYNFNLVISLLSGIIIMATLTLVPYFKVRTSVRGQIHSERQVAIVMQDLEQPHDIVAPPPPPPKANANVIPQVKYVPPVVVDSIMIKDTIQQMPVNENVQYATGNVIEVIKAKNEEVQEEKTEQEPYLNVQEMPEPEGGEAGMYKFIADNTHYPVIAYENNIQGKVYVRFCVTATGTVEQVSVLKGVDPDLDAEAIRVVKSFPRFKPGKQDGRPVPVWFIVPITFQII